VFLPAGTHEGLEKTGGSMQRRVGAFFLATFLSLPMHSAFAELPAIKADRDNRVPDCVTPGRLMAYLKTRNPSLDPRYEGVATEYMRIGEQLGVRWDFAFFQMIIETGGLSYRRGNRSGDVKPSQNNFAGLGATGNGEPGDSFPDIPSGVRAHFQHLLHYAGDVIDNPIAERTRKIQEWAVLKSWHAGFKRPITYSDLAAKWAPGTGSYRKMLEAVAERFGELCARPDPRPELVHEARAGKTRGSADTKMAAKAPAEKATGADKPSGADLARRAIEDGKAKGDDQRLALGAQVPKEEQRAITASTAPSVPFKLLNSSEPPSAPPAQNSVVETAKLLETAATDPKPKSDAPAATSKPASEPKASTGDKKGTRVASAAGAAKSLTEPATASSQKCRVWTASYGGQKAMIIRSLVDQVTNYTVLDVNEGAETREAEAFISAYAKNGSIAGQFVSQSQALEKAFELCPEG
jgi:hypothetical protein